MRTSSAKKKNSKRVIITLVFSALALMPGLASAQEPPGDAQLTVAKEEGALAAEPPGSLLSDADPCPAPAAAMASSPDDLAKIQADIDRYTLCMERALLLQRLNDLALENQESLMQSSGVSKDAPGMQLGTIPNYDQQRAEVMAMVNQAEQVHVEEDVPPPVEEDWVIMRISGPASDLVAKLGKPDGQIAQVRSGDPLPGGGNVESISTTSVSIRQDGKSEQLRWQDSSL